MAALAGVSVLRYRGTPGPFIGLYGAALRSYGATRRTSRHPAAVLD